MGVNSCLRLHPLFHSCTVSCVQARYYFTHKNYKTFGKKIVILICKLNQLNGSSKPFLGKRCHVLRHSTSSALRCTFSRGSSRHDVVVVITGTSSRKQVLICQKYVTRHVSNPWYFTPFTSLICRTRSFLNLA